MKSSKFNNAKPQPGTIVGTWKLIKHTDLDTVSGNWIYRYRKKWHDS